MPARIGFRSFGIFVWIRGRTVRVFVTCALGWAMRYVWLIRRPGNRPGYELWVGPLGLALTWPPIAPVAWHWGWWR